MFQTLVSTEAISFIKTQGENALVLDVRTPAEFETGHLPMAINIPVETIPARLAEIPNKTLVIYCEHGSRSKLAANFLSARGYHQVYHIQGGFSALAPIL